MKNQHGVTLVELLVAILIMTVISGVSIMLLNLSLTTESKVSIDNQLQREARFAMERVSETLLDGGTFNYEDNRSWEFTNVQSIYPI